MHRLALALSTILIAASAVAPALAQTGLNGLVHSVHVLDKNFDIADKNHDGKLDRHEAQNGPVPFIANHFDAIDSRRTGFVSKTDVHNYISQMLMRSQPAPPTSTGKS